MAGFALARGLKAEISTLPEQELSIPPRHVSAPAFHAARLIDKLLGAMNAWIKKIHIYTGLFNFTILCVFGCGRITRYFPKHRLRPCCAEFQDH